MKSFKSFVPQNNDLIYLQSSHGCLQHILETADKRCLCVDPRRKVDPRIIKPTKKYNVKRSLSENFHLIIYSKQLDVRQHLRTCFNCNLLTISLANDFGLNSLCVSIVLTRRS